MHVKVGDKVIHRQVKGACSYLARHTEWLHFGLGKASQVKSLVIDWPNGERQVVAGIPVNRRIRIVEGGAPEEPLPQ